MSLVSTYVLADDGMYYQDPKLQGKGWYICFDDDELPELVIFTRSGIVPGQICTLFIKEHKCGIQVIGKGITASRNYDDIHYLPAQSYWLKISNPIPVALIKKPCVPHLTPKGQCVIHNFGRPV